MCDFATTTAYVPIIIMVQYANLQWNFTVYMPSTWEEKRKACLREKKTGASIVATNTIMQNDTNEITERNAII